MTDATRRPVFDSDDRSVADLMMAGTSGMAGIPDRLGIRTTHAGPGMMTSELEVRPEMLAIGEPKMARS